MCEFCDPKTKIDARREAEYFSAVLVRLTIQYQKLANGKLKPHTDDTKKIIELSKKVIKELVEWI